MHPYTSALLNHLWQSTLFAVLVALVCVLLRHARARTRYWLWLAASLKFLLPFSLIVSAGMRFHSDTAQTAIPSVVRNKVAQVNQPFSTSETVLFDSGIATSTPKDQFDGLILWVWLAGSATLLAGWLCQWLKLRSTVKAALPLREVGLLPVLRSEALLEPAVFGVFKPVLLLPRGIEECLTDAQLDAIYAHELCHVRHRDNLAAAAHTIVQALFWFHPLVWWIGRKLIDERERACDEAVVVSGNVPEDYAEGILRVCKFCLSTPASCAAGVSGANLRSRIETIVSRKIGHELSGSMKLALLTACLLLATGPFLIGLIGAVPAGAQSGAEFEVASIKPSVAPPGRTHTIGAERYDIKAQAHDVLNVDEQHASAHDLALMEEERQRQSERLQTLLADRFQLRLHHVTKELPVYALIVDKNGARITPSSAANDISKTGMHSGDGSMTVTNTPIASVASHLSHETGRVVVDRTGLTGRYDFSLHWTPERDSKLPSAADEARATPAGENGPSLFTALEEQLGLKLVPTKGPVDILVIDHIEKPSAN